MDLRGARILVPGATGEIGAVLAVRLHTLGARTALGAKLVRPGSGTALEVVR